MMQTRPLPIQVSGASANPAPTRATGMAATDSAQFSQALSREMSQRQQSAAPPAQASEPAPANVQAAAPADAPKAPAKAADGSAPSDADTDKAKSDAADAAAVTPVTDMLALAASFKQPAAAPVADAAGAAAAQATGLPGVLGKQGKDEAANAALAKLAAGAKGTSLQDGAAAFGDAALKGAAARKSAAPGAAGASAATGGADALATLAGAAAQTSDANGASATGFKAALDQAAVQGAPVQPDPLRSGDSAAALKDLSAAAPLTAPVQQASAAIVQAATGAPSDRIAARVGTPGWESQVGQKIVWMVAGKEQSASLTLNPPDLGPMQVVLNVTNDHATVTFTSAQPEVRQALENAMPKLREMMSDSGIALGNATVNAGSPDQRQAQQGEQSRGGSSGGRFSNAGGVTAIPAVAARPVRLSGEGLVDTFA